MRKLKIFIDINYPKRLVDALLKIHALQKKAEFEIIRGSFLAVDSPELENAIFLLVDNKNRGVEITTLKHYEDGYRVIACKTGDVEKVDRFEFSMTVLRVWPSIIEKAKQIHSPFLFTFKYGGNRLSKIKSTENEIMIQSTSN